MKLGLLLIALQFCCYSITQILKDNFAKEGEPILIAVVDDAFNINHNTIAPFVFKNKRDPTYNTVDDDANGYLNDYQGYDVSDGDGEVLPPERDRDLYFHGTFIAGTICQVLEQKYGDTASQKFKILPIKVVSDSGDPRKILEGYKGIRYAIDMNADFIVCAWNGGEFNAEKSKLIELAAQKGITILASAGNEYSERSYPPASHPYVLSVAAIDKDLNKVAASNYGTDVDISYYGDSWWAPAVVSDTSFMEGRNTSLAVALTAGVAASMKYEDPNLTPLELRALLKNSADVISSDEKKLRGKLGAGLVNFNSALLAVKNNLKNEYPHNEALPEGFLIARDIGISTPHSWNISPDGDFYRTTFQLKLLEPYDESLKIKVSRRDSILTEWTLEDILSKQSIDGTNLNLSISAEGEDTDVFLSYESYLLDSSNYYCEILSARDGIQGSIVDGSGSASYVNETDCRWLITTTEGNRVIITFEDFATQADTDFVYIFDGDQPIQANMLARFSGTDLPPMVISGSNKVLVWFITNEQVQGDGWKMNYTTLR